MKRWWWLMSFLNFRLPNIHWKIEDFLYYFFYILITQNLIFNFISFFWGKVLCNLNSPCSWGYTWTTNFPASVSEFYVSRHMPSPSDEITEFRFAIYSHCSWLSCTPPYITSMFLQMLSSTHSECEIIWTLVFWRWI